MTCDGCGAVVDTTYCGECGRRVRATTSLVEPTIMRRVVYRRPVTARTWLLLAAAVLLAVAGASFVAAGLST